MTKFVVVTRDVDGSGRRTYKTRKAAIARFEEMLGRSIQTSIDEWFHALPKGDRPTPDTVKGVRDVSDYGTVVIFSQQDEA